MIGDYSHEDEDGRTVYGSAVLRPTKKLRHVMEGTATLKEVAEGGVNPEQQAQEQLLQLLLDKFKGHPQFYYLLVKMADLHSRKNQDYAEGEDPFSNFRACERAGTPAYDGLLTRLSDKNSRIEVLRKKQKNSGTRAVKEESVIDTHLDAAVYHLIGIVLFQEEEAEARRERC